MSESSKFIVVFKPDTPPHTIDLAIKEVGDKGGKITHRYESAMIGFAAELPDGSVAALSSNENVDYIEPDGPVSAYAQTLLSKK